uniref:Protein kinase domain-containing protein n=1 Tax=Macrostomum lignano TaxID=282301 RepID=A0A1I8FNH2_9PLAT
AWKPPGILRKGCQGHLAPGAAAHVPATRPPTKTAVATKRATSAAAANFVLIGYSTGSRDSYKCPIRSRGQEALRADGCRQRLCASAATRTTAWRWPSTSTGGLGVNAFKRRPLALASLTVFDNPDSDGATAARSCKRASGLVAVPLAPAAEIRLLLPAGAVRVRADARHIATGARAASRCGLRHQQAVADSDRQSTGGDGLVTSDGPGRPALAVPGRLDAIRGAQRSPAAAGAEGGSFFSAQLRLRQGRQLRRRQAASSPAWLTLEGLNPTAIDSEIRDLSDDSFARVPACRRRCFGTGHLILKQPGRILRHHGVAIATAASTESESCRTALANLRKIQRQVWSRIADSMLETESLLAYTREGLQVRAENLVCYGQRVQQRRRSFIRQAPASGGSSSAAGKAGGQPPVFGQQADWQRLQSPPQSNFNLHGNSAAANTAAAPASGSSSTADDGKHRIVVARQRAVSDELRRALALYQLYAALIKSSATIDRPDTLDSSASAAPAAEREHLKAQWRRGRGVRSELAAVGRIKELEAGSKSIHDSLQEPAQEVPAAGRANSQRSLSWRSMLYQDAESRKPTATEPFSLAVHRLPAQQQSALCCFHCSKQQVALP